MNIRVDLTTPIIDGTEVVFRSPVDCSQITGLIVYYGEDSKEFALADAHGNNVGDIDHLFAENVVVKVILDVTHAMAYVQNADTNAYIESTFVKSVNGVKPDKTGNVDVVGGNEPCRYIVTIEPNEDGTYTADATADELNAQLGTKILMCDYQGYLLPLKLVSDGNYYFSGIVDTTSIHVVVRSDGSAGVQERTLAQESEVTKHTLRYTPQDLTPEQQAQARENIGAVEAPETAEVGQTIRVKSVDENGKPTAWEAADFPAGGSGSNVFHFTTTVTEAVRTFTIELPTTFENIFMFNVHVTFGTIENDLKMVAVYGGNHVGFADIYTKDLVSGEKYGVNAYCVRYDRNFFSHNVTKSGYSYGASPGFSNIRLNVSDMSSSIITYYAYTTDMLIPAGTTFEIWGLCK